MSEYIYKGIKIAVADSMRPGDAAYDVLPALKSGGVMLCTTDTVCGLATRSIDGVEKIFEMKNRPPDARIAILLSPGHPIAEWIVKEIPLDYWMRELLPGPLTVVLPARIVRDKLPADVLKLGYETYGFRVPYYAPLWPLLHEMGGMLFATSANLHGEHAPSRIVDVRPEIASEAGAILDGGSCPLGLASAVAVFDGANFQISRSAARVPRLDIAWSPYTPEVSQTESEHAENEKNEITVPYWTEPPLASMRTVSKVLYKCPENIPPARRDMLAALAAWSVALGDVPRR